MGMRCSKCGMASENEEVCDTCGAVFAKVRARKADEEYAGTVSDPTPVSPGQLYAEDAGSPRATKMLLMALAVGAVAAFFMMRSKSGSGLQLENVLEHASLTAPQAPRRSMITGYTRLSDEDTSPRATLVNFWAPWCGPCKMYEPVMDQVTAEFGKDLKVVKLNLDENEAAAQRASVQAVPSVLIFDQNGNLKERFTGGPPPEELRLSISSAMK